MPHGTESAPVPLKRFTAAQAQDQSTMTSASSHPLLARGRTSRRANPVIDDGDERSRAVLRALGADLGLGELVFDEERSCMLKFDDVLIDIECPDGPSVYLTIALFSLHLPLQAAVLANLLQANLYGRGTAGAALACDKRTGAVFLQDRLDKRTLALPLLIERIAALAAAAEHWRANTPRDVALPPEPEPEPLPDASAPR
jgi:hypothetical protein